MKGMIKFSCGVGCTLLAIGALARDFKVAPDQLVFTSSPPEATGAEIRKQADGVELADTSSGKIGNAGSEFIYAFPENSPAIQAINAVLARPEGEPPVDFAVNFKFQELERSSRLLAAHCYGRMFGRNFPQRELLTDRLDLAGVNARTPLLLTEENFPQLRFQIRPSGGKSQLTQLSLRFGLRVDGDRTPERIKISDVTIRELGPQPASATQVAVFDHSAPAPALIEALNEAGYRWEQADSTNTGAELIFFGGRLDQEAEARKLEQMIRSGRTVVVLLQQGQQIRPEVAALLPFNPWSCVNDTLRRDGLSLAFTPPVALNYAFDLHLPGSPIENSEWRYLFEQYEKPLFNSNWRILVTARTGMPILISGRTGNARVLVFGGSLGQPLLTRSPGGEVFFRTLLTELRKPLEPQLPATELSDQVELSIQDFQPNGLQVILKNPAATPVKTVLSYQISNWEREVLNAETRVVELKGGGTRRVELVERGVFKGAPELREQGSSVPYRRIRAGILSPDRLKVTRELRQDVLVAAPVTIAVSENAGKWLQDAYRETIEGGADGDLAQAFIWRTGTAPEVTIRIRNRLTNLAPLARVRDEVWPENPTTPGLNDLSLSGAGVRQKGKWQGGWSGKLQPEQRLTFQWPRPMVLAGVELTAYGEFRRQQLTQPGTMTLRTGGKTLIQNEKLPFTANGSDYYARFTGWFAPQSSQALEVQFKPRPDAPDYIRINHDDPTNCSLRELAFFGWPVREDTAVTGTLEVTACDLITGRITPVHRETVTLAPYTSRELQLKLPGRTEFGPVRYDLVFKQADRVLATNEVKAFYLPPGHPEILNRQVLSEGGFGLLCTPGWVNYDSFGRGMGDWTQGWGGPHDKIWANAHGLMEMGSRNQDDPARMLTRAAGNTHYSNPWRYLPDGSYGWDLAVEKLIETFRTGRFRGRKTAWVSGEDRWNGIPIGACFGWDTFTRFDRFLKAQGGTGLTGRTRTEIAREITTHYADAWQKWLLEEYADKVIAAKKRFAEAGVAMTFFTHGSFPLAGGELGDKIAETHAGVGTDLFWELRNQDLYWSLGTRFSVVAANPNLRSGMYKQWGWINSDSNKFWFANNGPVEPARRQWYSTYFMGRVDSEGRFQPYHMMGYAAQGGVSTRFYPHEIAESLRVFNLTRFLRPEQPAGYGLVVSWDSHLRRMKPQGEIMGVGLFASGGRENQLEHRMGKLYEALIKNGLPIGFVSSSHALKKWNGRNPLVLLDASDWQGEELETVSRLLKNGTPIVAFGGDDQSAAALKFWTEGAEKRRSGLISYWVRRKAGEAPLLYCPQNAAQLSPLGLPELMTEIMKLCGARVATTPQLATNAFVSHDALFLTFGSLDDRSEMATLRLDPVSFYPALQGRKLRVIDLDRLVELEPEPDGTYRLPVAANSGRMVMITEMK